MNSLTSFSVFRNVFFIRIVSSEGVSWTPVAHSWMVAYALYGILSLLNNSVKQGETR